MFFSEDKHYKHMTDNCRWAATKLTKLMFGERLLYDLKLYYSEYLIRNQLGFYEIDYIMAEKYLSFNLSPEYRAELEYIENELYLNSVYAAIHNGFACGLYGVYDYFVNNPPPECCLEWRPFDQEEINLIMPEFLDYDKESLLDNYFTDSFYHDLDEQDQANFQLIHRAWTERTAVALQFGFTLAFIWSEDMAMTFYYETNRTLANWQILGGSQMDMYARKQVENMIKEDLFDELLINEKRWLVKRR